MDGIFKFGSADFSKKIRVSSYTITPNARQDLDSYRDADGVMHRTALAHTASVIEFNVKTLNEEEMSSLMSAVRESYINYNERDADCSYFDPETGEMKTGHFYLDSNLKFTIVHVRNGKKVYGETHFKFVEY